MPVRLGGGNLYPTSLYDLLAAPPDPNAPDATTAPNVASQFGLQMPTTAAWGGGQGNQMSSLFANLYNIRTPEENLIYQQATPENLPGLLLANQQQQQQRNDALNRYQEEVRLKQQSQDVIDRANQAKTDVAGQIGQDKQEVQRIKARGDLGVQFQKEIADIMHGTKLDTTTGKLIPIVPNELKLIQAQSATQRYYDELKRFESPTAAGVRPGVAAPTGFNQPVYPGPDGRNFYIDPKTKKQIPTNFQASEARAPGVAAYPPAQGTPSAMGDVTGPIDLDRQLADTHPAVAKAITDVANGADPKKVIATIPPDQRLAALQKVNQIQTGNPGGTQTTQIGGQQVPKLGSQRPPTSLQYAAQGANLKDVNLGLLQKPAEAVAGGIAAIPDVIRKWNRFGQVPPEKKQRAQLAGQLANARYFIADRINTPGITQDYLLARAADQGGADFAELVARQLADQSWDRSADFGRILSDAQKTINPPGMYAAGNK